MKCMDRCPAADGGHRTPLSQSSDSKSNEHKSLIGGDQYEPDEENSVFAFRGSGR